MCRKVNAGHVIRNCPELGNVVNKEVVRIVDDYVVHRTIDDESEDSADPHPSVPIINLSAMIPNTILTIGVDSSATIRVISPSAIKQYNLHEQPVAPMKLHQALDPRVRSSRQN